MSVSRYGPLRRAGLPVGVAAALNGAAAAPRRRRTATAFNTAFAARGDLRPFAGLGGLDALTAGTAAGLVSFRDSVRAATKRLEDAQPGVIMSWFQGKIGADSSVAAGKEDLRQQKKLLAIAETKVAGFLASGDEQAAAAWLANAKAGRWDDVTAGVAAGNQMSASAFVDQVVVQSGKDAAAAVKQSGDGFLVILKYLPYILAGGAAIYGGAKLWSWRRNRRLAAAAAAASPGTAGLRRRRRARRRT